MSGVWLLRPIPGRVFDDVPLLSPDQRGRHDRLRDADRRRQFAASRTAVAAVVAAAQGVATAEARWSAPAGRRPAADGFAVSIAHTGDATAVALAEESTPVGVDVEPFAPPADAVTRVLPADVRNRISGLPAEARWRAVLDAWLAAEALFKAGVNATAAYATSADGGFRFALARDGSGPTVDVRPNARAAGFSAEPLRFRRTGPQDRLASV